METETANSDSKKTLIMVTLVALVLLVCGTIGFLFLAKPSLVSPLPDGEVRVIFVSPEPTGGVASNSASLESTASATPASSATPKATPKPTPKVTPAASSTASPSATPQ